MRQSWSPENRFFWWRGRQESWDYYRDWEALEGQKTAPFGAEAD